MCLIAIRGSFEPNLAESFCRLMLVDHCSLFRTFRGVFETTYRGIGLFVQSAGGDSHPLSIRRRESRKATNNRDLGTGKRDREVLNFSFGRRTLRLPMFTHKR